MRLSHYILCTLLILLSLNIKAQQRGQWPGAGGPPGAIGGNFHVFGKFVDETGAGVSYASVLILKTENGKKTLLTGTNTDDNGEFSFENIEGKEDMFLQTSFLGYEVFEIALKFKPGVSEIDLGKLTLKASSEKIDEVVVTATAMTMKMDIDKKVFNVATNTITTGGTGEDVLKTIPSVNVDIDGNITLRNASPTILLDGRPTLLTPDQIPADAIENIEILTNPSAKFDASGGTGGIINLVMKKNKKSGYNGNIRAGIESVGAANAGFDFNVRQNKINFSFNGNYRGNKNLTDGFIERKAFNNGIALNTVTQNLHDVGRGNFKNLKAGIDYFITNKTTLSVSGNINRGEFNPYSNQRFIENNLIDNSIPKLHYLRKSNSDRVFKNNQLVLGFKQLLNTTGDEFTIDANYNSRKFDGLIDINTDFYNSDFNSPVQSSLLQNITNKMNNYSIVVQSDLIKTLGSGIKLEAGLRGNVNDRKTDNKNFNSINGLNQEVPNPNSQFNNRDFVYAAYTTLAKQIKNTGLKIGLRAESFAFEGTIVKTNQTFDYSYPISLFPSMFVSHKLNEKNDIQFGYSRRVNRPGFWQNVPFADSTDRFNITKGNPDLIPEFSSNFELGHMTRFKGNHTLLTTLYYKYTNDLISGYLSRDASGLLINTFINANSSYASGLELTSQIYAHKAIDFNVNFNVYNSKILLDNLGEGVVQPDALWSWFTKVNANFKLHPSLNLQIIGQYQSKSNLVAESGSSAGGGGRGGGGGGPWGRGPSSNAQGFIEPFGNVDIAIRKSFAKNKFNVILGMNDIFKTRYSKLFSTNEYFTQFNQRITNPRLIRLNITYNFGKLDTVLFKRKSKGAEEAPE